MNWMHSFYKTSSLAQNGLFVVITLAILVAGGLFIPEFKAPEVARQVYSISGTSLKYDDEPIVEAFFNSIVKNDGYLMMGTSESTGVEGGNYYDFLNNDPEIAEGFSVLSGAGRTCGMYFPVLLNHRDEVKGLKLIYYVNPAYWGKNLSSIDKTYWSRYGNYGLASSIELSPEEENKYYQPIEEYFDKLNLLEKATLKLEYWIRSLKTKYSHDLLFNLNPKKYEEELNYLPKPTGLDGFDHFGQINYDKIDTTLNTAYSFHEVNWFSAVNVQEEYRYRELAAFIDLCHDLGIEATFLVGPYNERFMKHYSPNSLDAYTNTTERIKALLEEKEADYIDATDISNAPGVFADHAHNTNYGAYLIYLKIKEHVSHE